jgi:hypothetical protein
VFVAIYTGKLAKVGRGQHKAAVAALELAKVQAELAQKQSELEERQHGLARWQSLTSHRPRLRVRNVVVGAAIGNFNSLPFAHGSPVSGQFYVSNIGGARATIVESHCEVLWNVNGLPMERPYEGLDGNNPLQPQVIEAGSSRVGLFMSKDTYTIDGTPGGPDGVNIFVLGWIEYTDDLSVKRRTAFCRQFLNRDGSARFYPVNDPDYEFEE